MGFNYNRLQQTADRMIRRFGAPAVLRRVGGDRPCNILITEFDPAERVGKLVNTTIRLVLMSAVDLPIPPNFERDTLVTFVPGSDPPVEDESLKIIEPPGRLAPAGVVVYWELHVTA